VKKGAFDEAEANRRFEAWMKQNEEKIESKKSSIEKSKDADVSKRLLAEKKVNEERAARLAKKQAELAAKEQAETASEEAPAEASAETSAETSAEAAAEVPAADETSAEAAAEEAATE
jgi:small subunit ribosomal protein S16